MVESALLLRHAFPAAPHVKGERTPPLRKTVIRQMIEESSLTPESYQLRRTIRILYESVGIRPMRAGDVAALLHNRLVLVATPDQVRVPSSLAKVRAALVESRRIVGMTEEWEDGEAGATVEETTWKRAVEFVWQTSVAGWRIRRDLEIPAPKILPLPDGSIDIDWKLRGRELLVNVPADPKKLARYYGDDGDGGNVRKADVDTSRVNRQLIMWLVG